VYGLEAAKVEIIPWDCRAYCCFGAPTSSDRSCGISAHKLQLNNYSEKIKIYATTGNIKLSAAPRKITSIEQGNSWDLVKMRT